MTTLIKGNHLALSAMVLFSQSPGRAGRVSSLQLPQPSQPRFKLNCHSPLISKATNFTMNWRNMSDTGAAFSVLCWHSDSYLSPLCLAWHDQCCDIWSPRQATPRGRILLKTEEETEPQSDPPRVSCPRAVALELGSWVTLNPCSPALPPAWNLFFGEVVTLLHCRHAQWHSRTGGASPLHPEGAF